VKLKIDAKPGELRARLPEVLARIEALALGGDLHKSDGDREEVKLLIPALADAAALGDAAAERIRARLERELVEIVNAPDA
jgi:hypothetical protein